MAQIIFPTSTAPSVNPTENGGRLINCYAEKTPQGGRSQVLYRRAPGCDFAFTAGTAGYRGALLDGTVLYIANGSKVYTVTKSGGLYTVTTLGGTLGGSGRVFMEHNMRSPTHQILIWTSGGIYQVSGSSIVAFSDPDLPSTNSLSFQDGYFFHTTASGQSYASDLNDTNVNSNSFVTAESQVDGLVRGIPIRRDQALMGDTSTEFWSNAGNATGYPFTRGPVIPYGLWGPYAVAGHEPGFPGPVLFVSNDGVTYRLDGYGVTRVSTPHLDRLVAEVTDRTTLRASVHICAGHSFWVLKCNDWTWVYDLSTGEWHERQTLGRDNWRMEGGINAFSEWLVFDDASANVYRMNERSQLEAGNQLVWELWSTQMHNFPARTSVDKAAFDFVRGVGIDRGISPTQTTPKVSISWSNDGGVRFGNALLRDLGTQGQQNVRCEVNRTGLTGDIGRQWKLKIADPVEAVFLGGSMFGEARAA
ncbi:hypothetical protein CK227_10465 [Mesorhizobium sp. WSM4308]|uniref:hypothetical protein n=1 Tax=Mesorhizobium sp. WSM4308 TaxID=2029409 RepID=UPI000BAF6730|nr:hypothetical protein [Mesorhizobium sp. WSM4308]PBB75206.1 hypothetical protein CK227_10465 [Mesorhizobium sp. WSM4308]